MLIAERYRGALVGLATGDAVGTSLEFCAPGSFEPLNDMVGGGPFELQPGQWTDDTSMMLCLASSLVEQGKFDAVDQMRRYLSWWRQGTWSCTGTCFDIGRTVKDALSRFEHTGGPYAGSTDPFSAGNGSIMRLAPVPLAYALDPARAIQMAAASSRTTHATREAVDGCRYLAALLVGVLRGEAKEHLLGPAYAPVPGLWEREPLAPNIAEVAAGSFRRRQPPAIQGSGYVVRSLEAALWAFWRANSFREGCLLAANLGDDADTTAAVFGQLAGAFYGIQEIPEDWRRKLAWHDEIVALADDLLRLAQAAP